jgi:hypothetical protein
MIRVFAMDFGRKLLLAALVIAASGAQFRDAAAMAFEVASVKMVGESNSLPAGFLTTPQRSGGRIHWTTIRSTWFDTRIVRGTLKMAAQRETKEQNVRTEN